MPNRKGPALGAASALSVLARGVAIHHLGADLSSPHGVMPGDPVAIAAIRTSPPNPVATESAVKRADPSTHEGWSQRLARQDEILVAQAVAAGCDEPRAAKLKRLLRDKEAHRARTIAALEAGTITEEEMRESAHATKVQFDAA